MEPPTNYCPQHDIFNCPYDPVPYEPAPCPTCGGAGWVPHPKLPYTRNTPCPDCTNNTDKDT